MQSNTLIKLIIAAAVIFVLWTKGMPWLKEHGGPGAASSSTASSSDNSCVSYAEAASSRWSSGITRFANPPYDIAAWGEFQSSVDSKIHTAEEKCACVNESCSKALEAMGALRSLLTDSDAGIRGNSPPPSDLVQRQEQVDNTIDAARDLARQGK